MFRTADIEVYMPPVLISLFADELFVVVRVHISEIVSRRARETRHGVELQREHRLVVYCRAIDH